MAQPGNHCTLHAKPKASTCSGHRAERSRPNESPLIANFSKGRIVSKASIEELRNKIRAQIDARKAHVSYNSASTAGLMDQLNLEYPVGLIVRAEEHAKVPFKIMNAVGGPGSPGQTLYTAGTRVAGGTQRSVPYSPVRDINGIWNSTATSNKSANIVASFYRTLISNYQTLYADCICHSDCACNAVCNCHNNCGCNYSDKRLKKEIIYW